MPKPQHRTASIGTLAGVFGLVAVGAAADTVLWSDNDDLPIPEPAVDREGEYQWWNDAWSLSVYQAAKVVDLGTAMRTVVDGLGLVGPREAANVNTLDEVPDSTWFANRHGRTRLSSPKLVRGPDPGPAPAENGPLLVVSGKRLGAAAGFVVEDVRGNRYLLKFDPPDFPDLATGAEIVSARIVGALGWHVPDYFLVAIDPERLRLSEDATTTDDYNRERPMTRRDLETILDRAARRKDGRLRTSASRILPGEPKGPFLMHGLRPDDPNDTIPHEHRRDLRGFRVIAAWINHTDFRPKNTLDVFVRRESDPPGRGRLIHYVLDFSSTLGSADLVWKAPRIGSEYQIDPPIILANYLTFGFWVKAWEDFRLVHPAIGFLEGAEFDPEGWKTEYPNPAFDHATLRDLFWGAKLVSSFSDDDLRAVVSAGEWSDPAAEKALFEVLAARRERIAAAFFDFRRINPTGRFRVRNGELRFSDLAVVSGAVPVESARYWLREAGTDGVETVEPMMPLPAEPERAELELRVSHDAGASWSPSTRLTLRREPSGALEVVRIDRDTRE